MGQKEDEGKQRGVKVRLAEQVSHILSTCSPTELNKQETAAQAHQIPLSGLV